MCCVPTPPTPLTDNNPTRNPPPTSSYRLEAMIALELITSPSSSSAGSHSGAAAGGTAGDSSSERWAHFFLDEKPYDAVDRDHGEMTASATHTPGSFPSGALYGLSYKVECAQRQTAVMRASSAPMRGGHCAGVRRLRLTPLIILDLPCVSVLPLTNQHFDLFVPGHPRRGFEAKRGVR